MQGFQSCEMMTTVQAQKWMWCVSPFSFRAPRLACYHSYLSQTEEGPRQDEQPSLCPGRPKQSAVGLRHPPIMVLGFRKAAGLFHH